MKLNKDSATIIVSLAVIVIIAILMMNIDNWFRSPDVDLNSITNVDVAATDFSGIDFGTNPDAKVIIVEYSDFECPYCARGADTINKIKENYGGQVNIIFKHFPVHGQTAILAASASECARDQDKFWEYQHLLWENQYKFSTKELISYAEDLGLDKDVFSSCLSSGEKNAKVQEDLAEGRSNGVTGTPTFFINGNKIVGAQEYSRFSSLIDSEIKGAEE